MSLRAHVHISLEGREGTSGQSQTPAEAFMTVVLSLGMGMPSHGQGPFPVNVQQAGPSHFAKVLQTRA